MTTFLIIGLMILPWVILPLRGIADAFRIPQATFLNLIFMGIISLSFYKGLRFNYNNKFLSLLVGWVFITIFFNWYLPYTMTFNNQQAINVLTLAPTLHFILGLWALNIMLCYFERDDLKRISKAICFSAVLVTSFGIMQVIGLDPFGKIARYNHPNHFSACLDNPNVVGNYLCLSLPFFFANKEKKYIWFGLLVFIGIVLSASQLAVGCSIVGLCFYALLANRKSRFIKIGVAAIIVLSIMFCFVNRSFIKTDVGLNRRLGIWTQTVEKIRVNPLFGQGLGKFRSFDMVVPGGATVTKNAHNDWLERVVEVGVLGTALLLLVVIGCFRKFDYRTSDKLAYGYLSSFLIFVLLMCASFPLEIAPTALLGMLAFTGAEKL